MAGRTCLAVAAEVVSRRPISVVPLRSGPQPRGSCSRWFRPPGDRAHQRLQGGDGGAAVQAARGSSAGPRTPRRRSWGGSGRPEIEQMRAVAMGFLPWRFRPPGTSSPSCPPRVLW